MIWVKGEVIPDDGLTINASDRTFEHGLGLFETMRTWGGRPVFLAKHRARMMKSAAVLRIPIDPDHFPDEKAVARLSEATGDPNDQVLRVTASGGSPGAGSVVWMKARSLPTVKKSFRIELGQWSIQPDNPLSCHKSLNFWNRRIARESLAYSGMDETLGAKAGEGYVEGSVSNVFVIQGGQWFTPSVLGPIIPGLMRRHVIDLARELGIPGRQVSSLDRATIWAADEVFLTNSLMGIMPVDGAFDAITRQFHRWPAPGPVTKILRSTLLERLEPGSHRP
jgi:branched-subunit amino acid aminotransferase/4-amino-4-deoxychorismate lyase